MKKLILTVSGCLILLAVTPAQHTVGLLSYQPSRAFDGYNLLYPHNQPNVYLLDNCGEIVHQWEDEPDFRPGNTAYLLEDGRLVKTKRPAAVTEDAIWAGGGGATVEIRDWDNNLEWSYTLNDSTARLHHDIEILPNGNILMIAWELKTREEAIQAGRDSTLLDNDELWPDYLFEINPDNNEIVWEWHVWDHLIQDFDPTKDNFGVVKEHPELININFDDDGHPDWLHSNAIDFDADRNQILMSVPFLSEIWVIDHSTTTQQAAGHTGGLGQRGGDLLYRWGNPQVYNGGTAEDQLLFNSHDAHWVGDFLTVSHPHYGKIAVFNNGAGADFSTVNVIDPPWDMYLWSYPLTGDSWGPDAFDVTLTHPQPTELFSSGLSSVQLLPNGNTLILSGRFGYAFELTPSNEIVWEYKTPLKRGLPVAQGDTLEMNDNLTFRIKRYPADYAAFEGRDLNGKGWIETAPDSTFCDQILPVSEIMEQYFLRAFPNPAGRQLTIEWEGGRYANIEIFDILGQKIASFVSSGGRKYLDVSAWLPGLYLVRINGVEERKLLIAR